jgi:hypothetical protein
MRFVLVSDAILLIFLNYIVAQDNPLDLVVSSSESLGFDWTLNTDIGLVDFNALDYPPISDGTGNGGYSLESFEELPPNFDVVGDGGYSLETYERKWSFSITSTGEEEWSSDVASTDGGEWPFNIASTGEDEWSSNVASTDGEEWPLNVASTGDLEYPLEPSEEEWPLNVANTGVHCSSGEMQMSNSLWSRSEGAEGLWCPNEGGSAKMPWALPNVAELRITDICPSTNHWEKASLPVCASSLSNDIQLDVFPGSFRLLNAELGTSLIFMNPGEGRG